MKVIRVLMNNVVSSLLVFVWLCAAGPAFTLLPLANSKWNNRNSLIVLETGAIRNESAVFKWEAASGMTITKNILTEMKTIEPYVQNTAPLSVGETFTIDSKVLSETRRINVYLPPGYSKSGSKRVPVLYMPDGGLGEDFLHISGLVQICVGNGTMRPFIVVGIENTERRRDLTGPTENEEDKKIAPRVGGSQLFRRFIRDELMPQVKLRYRTTNETAITGESLAGLFVLETFMLEPELFDSYIAIDPSLWWNDQKLLSGAPERLRSWSNRVTRLYFASSNEPSLAATAQRLADVLKKNAPSAIHWHYEKMPEEKHSTIYHPAALKAFRAVFGLQKTDDSAN